MSPAPPEERQAEADRLLREEPRRPFRLDIEPGIRITLVRLGPEDHLLLVMLHHIVCDGWSMAILFRELAALYRSPPNGDRSPLPPPPLQYGDYASYQQAQLESEAFATELAFWTEYLRGAPDVVELPTDRPRPDVLTFEGEKLIFPLGRPATERLRDFSRREGVSLFMTLTAAFNALISRYTGQDDIVLGVPIANRDRPELASMFGFLIDFQALRTDLSGSPTFRQLLQRVRDGLLVVNAHRALPFDRVVKACHPHRDPSRSPLFQIMLIWKDRDVQMQFLELEGLSASHAAFHPGSSKYDLTLYVTDANDEIWLEVEYNTKLYDAETISRLAIHFETLLDGAVADPSGRAADLPMLSEAERRRLLVECNDAGPPFDAEECISDLFEDQVRKTPDAIAVEHDGRRLSYADLNRRVDQLARHLQGLGVGAEVRVGVCVERTPEMVVGLLAILKAGGAYVPLDPAYPRDRIAFMLQDSQATVLLSQTKLAYSLPAFGAKVVWLDADWPQVADEPQMDLGRSAGPANLAYVIYTSGSTGVPKGVAIEHRNTVALIKWAQGIFTPEELSGVLASTSLCFDLSVYEIFVPLCSGGRVVLVENALALEALPQGTDVTLVNTVPSVMVELVMRVGMPESVLTVNLAGEPLSTDLVDRIYRETRAERVYDLYGPSEDTTYSTYTLRRLEAPATIGRPISGTQAYVLDGNRQLVPFGMPGELYIGGSGLARGYLNRPDLTADRFIPNPFPGAPSPRLYQTGDLVRYQPDGDLVFLGRLDHQVKVRGFRIELGEIEGRLRRHLTVQDAVVVAAEDTPGEKRLVAYVVGKVGESAQAAELRAYLKQALPAFMAPSAFVILDRLPTTPNGKVDRKALPAPERISTARGDGYTAPRNDMERQIAEIWAETLGVGRVSVEDDFFELGGHSLLVVSLSSRLGQALSRPVPDESRLPGPDNRDDGRAARDARRLSETTH